MKVFVPKDFGNTSKKPVLPVVPKPTRGVKKEDLPAVMICSDPADRNSTQVKFTFKGLDGDSETPREILGWRDKVERALKGLGLTAGLTQHTMAKQFNWGSALSSCESLAMVLSTSCQACVIVHLETQLAAHPAAGHATHDPGVFVTSQGAATTATGCNIVDHLNKACGQRRLEQCSQVPLAGQNASARQATLET